MAEGSSGAEIPIPVSAKETRVQKPTEVNKSTDKLPNEPSPPAEHVSKRRRLLKGLAAAAALTGLAFWGNKEIKAGKEGIETPNATFIPLYERHDVGVAAKDIPNDLDVFVREGGGHAEGVPGYAYVAAKMFVPMPGGSQLEVQSYQEGVLEKLAQNGTKVAKADIDNGVTLEEAKKIASVPFIAGMATGLATMIYGRSKGFIDELKGNTPDKKELSRRSFIKKLGYGTAAVASSAALSGIAMPHLPAESGATGRIIARLNAMQSHAHPEDLLVFIRNVFTADKMLTIAEQLKSEKNQKLKIGINYGSAHAGIEDFLVAGPEVCRTIINMFPKKYLQHVVNSNGSAENLASAAVIEMPRDFKITDLKDRDKAMRIQVRKITDTKLSQQLQSVTK